PGEGETDSGWLAVDIHPWARSGHLYPGLSSGITIHSDFSYAMAIEYGAALLDNVLASGKE
ncbi:MAG: hypothetical protein ACOC0D_03625, partial [Spirochaeta sp.]